ncbi:MAG: hypothetical protein HUU22_12120 [Phycisphaerae bacterium]|nr:hypothetical protein [Phycisphaerae bacterium]NUQ46763.1 hypothetical protein [Phycisphaerae bacterium]
MTVHVDTGPAETCVWMDAGVLTYKLCDRDFDCEHCPFDAVMRGDRTAGCNLTPDRCTRSEAGIEFPADRLYGEGHTWCQAVEENSDHVRVGLDSLAASLIAGAAHIFWTPAPVINRGEMVCAIEWESRLLNIGSPVAGRMVARNRTLDDDPTIIPADPYGRGWIAELAIADEAELARLLTQRAGQQQARLDLRRLRRIIAFHMLADESDDTLTGANGNIPLLEARRILDRTAYLNLVAEILHLSC